VVRAVWAAWSVIGISFWTAVDRLRSGRTGRLEPHDKDEEDEEDEELEDETEEEVTGLGCSRPVRRG
jgi:hypothetical protein